MCNIRKRQSKIRRNAEKDLQKQIDQLMNVLKTNKSKENITIIPPAS